MTKTINNVPRDWFDRVHALLYKVACENTPEGLEAECLGSFIPDILSAPSPAGVDDDDEYMPDGIVQGIMQSQEVDAVALSAKSLKAAGVGGLEVVAWRIGFPNNAGYKVYEQRQPWAYEQYGVPSVIVYEVQELCRLSDAQAIIDGLRGEVADLHTTMMAAAVEIQEHWAAHCDEEGYGPANLMHRLERGIASQYGYSAETLVRLESQRDQQAQRIGDLEGLLRHAQKQVPTGSGLHMRIDFALSAGKEGE